MRFAHISAALALAGAALSLHPAAHATEDEFGVTNGLYTGTVREPRGPREPASVELTGEAFVMIDAGQITVGRANFVRFGPGGKDGRTTFKGTWTLAGAMTRAGKPVRIHRGEAPVALTVWPDGRAVFCHPIGKYNAKSGEVRVPPGASMSDTHVRCLDLARTSASTQQGDEDAPPVPQRAWEATSDPCVAECIKADTARAVPISQIIDECEQRCAPLHPPQPIEPPRLSPLRRGPVRHTP